MNIKKKISGFIAAALCCTMLTGTAVYAEDSSLTAAVSTTADYGVKAAKKSVWSETKSIAGATYNSNYIKLAEKYSKKEKKKSISFGKSRTKKFFEKFYKNMDAESDEVEYRFSALTKDEIMSITIKEDKYKVVVYEDGEGMAVYITPKEMTILSVNDKKKMTMPIPEDYDYSEITEELTGTGIVLDDVNLSVGIDDDEKGKYFKIKSGEKIYYYEEFEYEDDTIGMLFSEKGTPLALASDGFAACFTVSYSVKDSEFNIPKGYKEAEIDD